MADTRKPSRKGDDTTTTAGAAGSGDSGPGTGTDAPADEQTRSPDRATARQPDAAPLVAPDATTQTQPEGGYRESSTDPVAAASGVRTQPGTRHRAVVDDQGNQVDPGDLFSEPEGPQTYRVVKRRVYERFTYPGSATVASHLLFPAGQRVSRPEAARIEAAFGGAAPQPTFDR